MDKDKQETLFKKYPTIFRDIGKPMNETAMYWGIQFGNGWEGLLDETCSKITQIEKITGIKTVANTLKEKYGIARFYTDIYTEDARYINKERMSDEDIELWIEIIDIMISEFEWRTAYVCEMCGKPGELRQTGWVLTLCQECLKKKTWEQSINCLKLKSEMN